MARNKWDGVIEAVHYATGGNIVMVRVYERHGLVWSDYVLLRRNILLERLKQGKRFVVGTRILFLGSEFVTGSAVHQVNGNIMTDDQTGTCDLLTGVSVF
jgi:hypothetical protein